ncbi:MAG: enoyl-CoA hydratase/isomerase family protein [Gemmatimonadetes bacterium]|nr:enoyl-CoA hydratase/isomerase family protein [Gemmatimonadota bacterium]
MSDVVTVGSDGDVAVVRIDNPPVNALDRGVREALAPALARVAADDAVRAVVLVCAGRTFVAGADIGELERAAWSDGIGPDMHPLLAQVEDFPKPIVAAIHGTALGGGLELAMACHYRVAVESARLGLPEVTLGIIPGAEGTQRLPRLVGVEKALDMGLTGRPIAAPDALASGLIDHMVAGDDLLTAATAFAREQLARGAHHPRTRDRADKLGTPEQNAPLFAAARETARRTKPHIPAAALFVDAVEAAATLPFESGIRRERELSAESVRSEPCKALLHLFLAERAATKIPDVTRETPAMTVNRVAIVGAGTMGGGIAMACANAGISVLLRDATSAALEKGMESVRRNYAASVKRGRMTDAVMAERLARIQPQVGTDGFGDADLVIEAVFESMELKRTIFAELDRVTKPDCVLATNTSTLDIDAIAAVTSRPERVVGLHFFSPANVMRLLEIVRGAATSPEVVASALGLAKRLGKIGVVVRNLPGFVGNRMMFPYMYETQFLVEEGATPEQVDRVLTRWGMAMGMFAVDDMAGLDVAWRVRQELGHFSDPSQRRPLVADQLYAMGRYGQKTGSGWFRYSPDVGGGRTPIPDPEVLDLIARTATGAGIARRDISDDEIVERAIYALINEGARVLEDGGALRASDIDVVYANGYGFPGWRGGPMFYADRVGLRRIHDRIATFHRELGPRWEPAPLLARLAREGRTFRELDALGSDTAGV